MYLLESFHIFVFVLDTVFVKLINFSRTTNVPSDTSIPFGGKSEKKAQTHIIRRKSAGQVVARQSPMTVGPICVQIRYSLTEILKEIFACYLQYSCVTTL